MKNNDGETKRDALTTSSETFHEIIYGKPRGAKVRRVFFVPTPALPSVRADESAVEIPNKILINRYLYSKESFVCPKLPG